MTRPLPLLALLALAGASGVCLPGGARAQDGAPILSCTAAIEGAVSCLSGKLCLCRFDPGGELTARPPRHRWDCGINRPSCGTAPADLYASPGMAGPLPIAPIQPQLLVPYGGGAAEPLMRPPGGGPAWR